MTNYLVVDATCRGLARKQSRPKRTKTMKSKMIAFTNASVTLLREIKTVTNPYEQTAATIQETVRRVSSSNLSSIGGALELLLVVQDQSTVADSCPKYSLIVSAVIIGRMSCADAPRLRQVLALAMSTEVIGMDPNPNLGTESKRGWPCLEGLLSKGSYGCFRDM